MPRNEVRNGARLAVALGLGLTLSLGAAPVVAMAEGVTNARAVTDLQAAGVAEVDGAPCATLAEVIAKIQANMGGTVKLLQDVELSSTLTVADGMNVTLDLNGCTVTEKGATDRRIINDGSLTITDSSNDGSGTIKNEDEKSYGLISNNGSLTIVSGTFVDVASVSGSSIRNNQGAEKLVISGGTFIGTADDSNVVPPDYSTAANARIYSEAPLEITGGIFSSEMACYTPLIKVAGDEALIQGVVASTYKAGVVEAAGGVVTITDCSFTVSDQNSYYANAVAVSNGGKVTINGGTYSGYKYGAYVYNSGGYIEVNGGTFTAETALKADKSTHEDQPSKIAVSDGRFNGSLSIAEGASLSVSGGRFTSESVGEYLVPGVSYDANSDTVTPNASNIATVTDKDDALVGMYDELSKAIANVPDGGTVALTKEAAGDGVVVKSGKNFTLDLGGFTYTVSGATVGSPGTATNGFQLLKDSNITIKNGAITSENAKILIQNYSNLRLEDVALLGGATTNYVLSNNNGETHIGKGTTITAAEGKVAFDVCRFSTYPSVSVIVDEGAGEIKGIVELSDYGEGEGPFALTINGGDFTKASLKYDNDAVAGLITVKKDSSVEFSAPGGYRWVDDGYGPTLKKIPEGGQDDFKAVARIGDVQYESLATAVAQARPHQTVELLADVELEEALMPAAGITIEGNNKTISLKAEIADGPFIDVQKDGVTIKNVTINTNGYAKHGVQFYCVEGGSLENCTINGGSYTSVQVNNSTKIKVSDCNLNPAASDDKMPYANIELSVGANIADKVTPSLDVTGQAEPSNGLPFVYVDADTMARVLGKEDGDSLSDDDKRQAINRLNENLSGAQLSLTDDGNATGEKPHTPVAPPAQTGERVEVEQPEGAEVSVSPSRADEGDVVTVTVTPDEGREAVSVTVTDEDGNVVEVKPGEKDGTWTFEMPDCAVTVTAETRCDGGDLCPSRGLADVVVGEWYHDAVDWAIDAGVMSGYGHVAAFGPSDPISRAQLAQVLWNRAGRPDADASAVGQFPDCSADEFYAEAVAWCSEAGIMTGYEDGDFGPSDEVIREQLATVLWRAAGSPEADTDLSAYPDAADVSEFAEGAMAWAVEIGAVSGQGFDGTLDPVGTLERAQCAMVLYRLAE